MQSQVFDSYAQTYDDHFTNSLIGKAQRKQVYKYLKHHTYFFNKIVLEINCGTGEDALWLMKEGARVTATDISSGMLETAKAKNEGKHIEFKQLAAQNIGQLSPEKFQSIFSNFGGLNCLSPEELQQFKNGCAELQDYEDQIVLVIMGTKCLWEKLYFTLKKDKEKATRRLNSNGVETVIGNENFKTYYYSPKQIRELFKDNYYHINTKPIGLFVPPSYLEPYFKKRKVVFHALVWIDKIFGRFSFLSNYADHYLIVFEKK